jgi:HEAT repeat protein
LQKEAFRELQGVLHEQEREQRENAQLDQQERQLALQLFQKSTLNIIARRLTTAKSEELRKHIVNQDPVIRFLVVHTIGSRHLHAEPDLIERLKDPDPVVREIAHTALVRVARGTDFGPLPGFSQTGISRSVEKWRHWLALQTGESPDEATKDIADKPGKIDSDKAVHLVLDHGKRELQTASPEVTQLCDELVKAKGDEQTSVLAHLRDAKGIDNTDALALAIPKLSGAIQRETRDALAQRLTRMTVATLRDKLQEDAVEVRRAAALACGRKKATEYIPDLLQLLDDPEVAVIQAARTALKELTGEDFGPDEEAGQRGRASAAAAWRKWWKEHPSEQN